MAVICDTSGLFALYDATSADHAATVGVVEAEGSELLVPVALLVEADYLLHSRLGADAARDFLRAVERGEFIMVPFLPADVARCGELLDQYRDLDIGLADAAVVATAERLAIRKLLCLDQRHFRVITPRNFSHFTLLPADAP
jgi:predicted nucleic acid-binding protein